MLENTKNSWFRSEAKSCIGVVVLFHGLNNRAELMHPIAEKLAVEGFSVLVPVLSGHHNDYQAFKNIQPEQWENDVFNAYNEALKEQAIHQCNLYYMGFSLGGLLGVLLKAKGKMPAVNKMCLLAPALELTVFASLLRPLLFLNIEISIPSRAPGFYRAHNRLPLQVYRAFIGVKNQLFKNHLPHANIPTLVFIDKKDELVSYKKLVGFVHHNKLQNWQINLLNSKESKGIHHMIADPFYAGELNWNSMLNRTITFFKSAGL